MGFSTLNTEQLPEEGCPPIQSQQVKVLSRSSSGTWPSGTTRRLQILCDGFDLRLPPIAFDVFTGWLLTGRAQACFAVQANMNEICLYS